MGETGWHGSYGHLNCRGYHHLFRPKAGQDALIEFTKRTQDTYAFWSSGHEVSGVLIPSFQDWWGSFRALKPCRDAVYPCTAGSWVFAEDYTAKNGNAPLVQGASYCMCKSHAFGEHTASWRAMQSSLDASALQIMGACCVLQGCESIMDWNCEEQFLQKMCARPVVLCTPTLRITCVLRVLSVCSLSETRFLNVLIFSRNET